MEQKTIQFSKGIHRAPSQALEDGELSECVNLLPKNGELTNAPVAVPTGLTLADNETLICVHTLSTGEVHYIVRKLQVDGNPTVTTKQEDDALRKVIDTEDIYVGGVGYQLPQTGIANISQQGCYLGQCKIVNLHYSLLYYYLENGVYTSKNICDTFNASSIFPMGNVLVCNTENGVMYIRWKSDKYIVLHNIPDYKFAVTTNNSLETKIYKDAIKIVPSQSGETGSKILYGPNTGTIKCDNNEHEIWSSSTGLISGYTYRISIRVFTNAYVYARCYLSDGTYTDISLHNDTDITPSNGFINKIILSSRDQRYEDEWADYTLTISQLIGQTSSSYVFLHDDDNGESNYNSLIACASDFSDYCQNTLEKFIYPFFVRCAIELYDGNYIHMSIPSLVVPNWGNIPLVIGTPVESSSSRPQIANIHANTSSLNVLFNIDESLADWEDIIRGISIAITPAIYHWNQGMAYNKDKNLVSATPADYTNLLDLFFVSPEGQQMFSIKYPSCIQGDQLQRVILPPFDNANFEDNLLGNNIFYIVKSYSFNEIKDAGYNIERLLDVKGYMITKPQTLPQLPDDYNSRNLLQYESVFCYNNRLSLANIKETIRPVYDPASPKCSLSASSSGKAFVYVNEDNSNYIIETSLWAESKFPMWVYYPHPGAYKIVLYRNTGDGSYWRSEVNLKSHPSLNGAYWFGNGTQLSSDRVSVISESESANLTKNLPNYIYTSAVNNPFYFPPELQDTIGSGEIKAVTTSAKALSQGQFGQFPLYAFCTDGIWALSVAADGKYATTNPISRDVVENIASICQIDSAVVFATAQGLKLLEGSQTALLSEMMSGENTDESKFFSGIDKSDLSISDTNSFVNMLADAKMMYDYTNMLIHIYPSNVRRFDKKPSKHYVFSMQSKEWSTVVDADSDIKAIVPGYPYSAIQTETGAVKQYQPTDDQQTFRDGIILTRPVSIDSPFAPKILHDLKLFYRKTKTNTKCKVAIFASNDCLSWTKVKSLKGHSFKWYRFRIQTHMTDQDALSAMTALYEIRQTNKLR